MLLKKLFNPPCYLSGQFRTKVRFLPFAFQINKPRRKLSSAQHKLLPRTFFWTPLIFQRTNQRSFKDELQLQENLVCVCVRVSQQIHARFAKYCIRRLCCGTSVATCWWSLTDGCSLFFYTAVRSRTSHLSHIVAGSQHGPKGSLGKALRRVRYKNWGLFLSFSGKKSSK